MADLLPNALTQFLDDNGFPLSLGTVTYYIPSTTSYNACALVTFSVTPVLP